MIASDTSVAVLLVEDDEGLRFGLRSFLSARGYRVFEATSCAEAIAAAAAVEPDVVLLDHELPDGDAIGLMARLRAAGVTAPFVVLTGHGTIPLAVEALKRGARDFLTKPVELPRLLLLIAELALERARARGDTSSARGEAEPGPLAPSMPTASKTLWQLERQALVDALMEEGGRVGRAAKRLSIPRSTFYLKIKAHEIDVDGIREGAMRRTLASSMRTKR